MNLLKFVNSITDKLSDNPLVYTYVRLALTGDQTNMRAFVEKYLDKYRAKTVADICCGTGDFAALVPSNTKYVGWDNNRSYINFAKRRFSGDKNKSFVLADVVKSKAIRGKKYDVVFFISTMHHFSDKELEVLLPSVKRNIGKALIVTDIIPDPPTIYQKFFTKIDRGKFVRPRGEKLKILKKYFKIIKTQLISTGSVVQYCIICTKK